MKDQSNAWTEEHISALEKRIEAVFRKARDDLSRSVQAYFAGFVARDNAMKKRVEAGEVTEREYRRWLRGQLTAGQRWKALRDKVAQRMTEAREVAIAYANDETPGIYSLNRNYAAFTIEGYSDKVDFTLWDERTVRNLIVNEPNLMPYYPPPLAVSRDIDLNYGKRVITDVVTSAILRGSSIPKIAKELMDRIPDMSRQSATRAARTAVGSAQNAGRMDAAVQAEKMGLQMEKWWMATLDNRTRDSHQALDGQHVPVDKPFSNGLMFPKDPNGPPSEVYNCRCTMTAIPKGVDPTKAQRRARDPVTGKSVVVNGMTYREWAAAKQAENKTAWDVYVKKGKRMSSDRTQHAQYRKILGRHIPKELDDFQNLKYNEPEKWALIKLDKHRREELAAQPEKALPGDRHVIPSAKFTGYLFNPDSQKGWAKGQAFTSHLGYSAENWQDLKKELSEGSRLYPSTSKGSNGYGELYEQKMVLYGITNNPANVVVGWILKPNGETHLTTVYFKEVKP